MRFLNTMRHVKNWPTYYARKMFGGLNEGFVFTTAAGRIEVPARLMHTFKEIFFDSQYLGHLPESVTSKHNPVVIDIGANVGYFSIFALGYLRDPRVYSFEPIPANFLQMTTYHTEVGGGFLAY